MRDLPRVVAETAVGKAVPVTVLRDGKQIELAITLGRLEVGEKLIATRGQEPAIEAPEPEVPAEEVPAPVGLSDLVGFDVAPLDEGRRAQFGIAPEADGVVVTDVKGGSDADLKGVIPGLIVTEVNQRRIATIDELNQLVEEAREAGRPAVLFRVLDPAGTSRFIAVRLG
jgi:serine protease Do